MERDRKVWKVEIFILGGIFVSRQYIEINIIIVWPYTKWQMINFFYLINKINFNIFDLSCEFNKSWNSVVISVPRIFINWDPSIRISLLCNRNFYIFRVFLLYSLYSLLNINLSFFHLLLCFLFYWLQEIISCGRDFFFKFW